MRCNGFKHEYFFVKQKCKEFPAFTSLEVRFLVDSNSCSSNKSFTNAIVVPPSNSSRCNTRHTHTYAQIILRTVTGLVLGLFVQLLSMGDSRTERLHTTVSI